MAITIEGESECFICGGKLKTFEDIIMFPPLISNVNDQIFTFSDEGIHAKCFSTHPLADIVNRYTDQYDNMIFGNRPATDLDGNVIEDSKDVMYIGLLTSDPSEELHRYNFLTFNRRKLANWNERNLFLTIARKYLDDGKWKSYGDFNLLGYLIERFELGEK